MIRRFAEVMVTALAFAGLGLTGGQAAEAAERIAIQFGYLGRSIPVSSLEAFATDGTIDLSLRWYLRNVSPDVQSNIRQALTASRDISPSELSQLLHTPIGTSMLLRTGQFIQTDSGRNGARAIRGALVVGSTQPEGLSLLNFVKAFPSPEMTLDLGLILARYRNASRTIEQIDTFLASVKDISQLAAAEDSSAVNRSLSNLPDLSSKGDFEVIQQTLIVEDPTRNRSYPVDLYRPDSLPPGNGADIPVLVMSHGLGGTRTGFQEFGEHLASYGFVVAMPEHLGSNKDQQDGVRDWLEDELLELSEFIERPRDVSFVIDELERLNPSEFEGRLNVEQVGLVGHSFGGYTVLSLAGATIDFNRVNRLCESGANNIDVGLALLLTCRAQELLDDPEALQLLKNGELKDERVTFVAAINPVSNLFGETGMSQIQIPVVMVGGIADFATPILREQAEPFAWLTTPEKFLIVAERASHNEEITSLINQAFYSVDESEEDREIAREEFRMDINALMLVFSEVYVRGDETYRPFISSAYIEWLVDESFPLHMTTFLPPESLPSTLD